MKRKWIIGIAAGMLMLFGGAAVFLRSADADQGRSVYAAQKCSICHSIAGIGGEYALDGVGARLKADDMRRRVRAPRDAKPGSEMKAYPNLPDGDINNLIAYLQTLK